MSSTDFTLAHLSDPHLTSLTKIPPKALLNKRILGYLSWQLRRRFEHRPEVLVALVADLSNQHPDHIAITGDLTQLGLPQECRQAAQWLERLGPPRNISVVPGNHDTYVPTPWDQSLAYWRPYMTSDPAQGDRFPFLRRRGPVALIGVNSAVPTAPLLASGTVGNRQLERLASLLKASRTESLLRIVLIHHPPHPEAVKSRKRLTDWQPLQAVLQDNGCELILHGHSHLWQLHWLAAGSCNIPIVAPPSASAIGRRRGYRARYHLYRLRRDTVGPKLTVEVRGLAANRLEFRREGEFCLPLPSLLSDRM